jgi:hypothetical protein
MESITRNVRDIPSDELRLYETVLGAKLRENQQVIIQVISVGDQTRGAGPSPEKEGDHAAPGVTLPDWCNVYEGLSDEEISGIESVVLDRSGWTRTPQ